VGASREIGPPEDVTRGVGLHTFKHGLPHSRVGRLLTKAAIETFIGREDAEHFIAEVLRRARLIRERTIIGVMSSSGVRCLSRGKSPSTP